jgi:NAD(P)-dependent dehydrogenase (short-subunit alcohol dehydrogenase family)
MKDLAGRVAFVTGGSSGIGLGIVKVLAAEGMKVAFTYRRQDHLDETMAHFREHPQQSVLPVKLDVTDRPGMKAAADAVDRELGPVQLLVNNAGIGVHGLIEHATYDDWDWVLGVNLGGTVNGIVTFLPRMIAGGLECHVVNVASIGGIAALGSVGLYATSKFAIVGLTEALRTDLIGRPIGVSVYLPGPVKSNIGESGKSRPAALAETGYTTSERREGEPPPDFVIHAMAAVEAGRYVLDGIRENKLWIQSHPEFRDVIGQRNDALLASFPDEPINQARADAARWILSNRIYSDGA